jgi:hypothetical protein
LKPLPRRNECGGITYDREGAAVERGTAGAALAGVALTITASRLAVRSDAVAAGYLTDAATPVAFARNELVTDDLFRSTAASSRSQAEGRT